MNGMNYAPRQYQLLPGFSKLVDSSYPRSIFLLTGPAGVGKTMYCKQFLRDGLLNGEFCLFISSSLTQKQFWKLFSGKNERFKDRLDFVNPYAGSHSHSASEDELSGLLAASLSHIREAIMAIKKDGQSASSSSEVVANSQSVRLVLDSVTHLVLLFGERAVTKFVTELSILLKEFEALAIFTLASSEQHLGDIVSSFVDGIIEMKLEEHDKSIVRSIRLLSIKGVPNNPLWISFVISDDGILHFTDETSFASEGLTCNLCGKPITGTSIIRGDLTFDTAQCEETYRRFAAVYGPNISETGLPSGVVNIGFFFIDIVGLSDPSLSVRKQMHKIETLNKLIDSCEAFKKTPKEKKIVLPTGDGMAIGFLLNPELPLELAIQLHKKLRAYNMGRSATDNIAVRIGLGSGPVFVATDMNNNPNVWGPGIILARRVMDAGDAGHILVADKTAEELIALKDEYKAYLNLINTDFEIKHGQSIKLYSAHSFDFGNPNLPEKGVPRHGSTS